MQSSEPHDAGVGVGFIECELAYDEEPGTMNVDEADKCGIYDDDAEEADATEDVAALLSTMLRPRGKILCSFFLRNCFTP